MVHTVNVSTQYLRIQTKSNKIRITATRRRRDEKRACDVGSLGSGYYRRDDTETRIASLEFGNERRRRDDHRFDLRPDLADHYRVPTDYTCIMQLHHRRRLLEVKWPQQSSVMHFES